MNHRCLIWRILSLYRGFTTCTTRFVFAFLKTYQRMEHWIGVERDRRHRVFLTSRDISMSVVLPHLVSEELHNIPEVKTKADYLHIAEDCHIMSELRTPPAPLARATGCQLKVIDIRQAGFLPKSCFLKVTDIPPARKGLKGYLILAYVRPAGRVRKVVVKVWQLYMQRAGLARKVVTSDGPIRITLG